MAEAQTVKLDGVDFQVHQIGTNYKDKPGVYSFMKSVNNQWTILYIGETESLNDRLSTNLEQHHRYDCAVTNGKATHLATRIVSGGKKARLDLETQLRNVYDPPCNRQ